jgi:Na+-transporting NADH:ubiquinone oxidoreductase subunit C
MMLAILFMNIFAKLIDYYVVQHNINKRLKRATLSSNPAKTSSMNKNSNTYTYLYATIMVVLVAVGLAFTNGLLKEKQAKNVELDKMMQILRSVKVEATAKTAEESYATTIKMVYLVNSLGVVTETDARAAFMVDMAKEVLKPLEERKLPVYEASVDGQLKYILPVYGAGLWGPSGVMSL